MTPEQKAIDILEKLIPHVYNEYDGSDGGKVYNAKRHTIQCALIALRETVWGYLDQQPIEIQNYWKEVKNELEKL